MDLAGRQINSGLPYSWRQGVLTRLLPKGGVLATAGLAIIQIYEIVIDSSKVCADNVLGAVPRSL